jgi:anti-sigma regulatory factor (Ser/Thr protein kinase)
LTSGIEEHLVWRQINDVLHLDEGSPAGTALPYAITAMLNNAIDHSQGTTATVAVWATPDDLTFRISDDGQGVFAHLRRGLGLVDDFESISALSKGRQTTWKERHTGEGIFFTSKVLDVFQLSSNGIRWTVDNVRGDHAVGVSDVQVGTVVVGQIDPQTTRSTRDVFRAYSQDFQFVRTRPIVKLFGIGLRFVSRSEARRILTNLDEFTEIDVDFAGVEDVGQGFVDELLRVWPQEHPGKTINPINMNEAVEFMVRRGLSR